jgi:N-formylglutamate amidohydrolase
MKGEVQLFRKIILAIPHSVRRFNSSLWSDPATVDKDADRWTDWFTDDLFAGRPLANISAVIGQISRFDCDLERLMNDPLEDEGRGILYTRSHSGATRTLTKQQRDSLLQYWHAYREHIAQVTTPDSLLIDCHSFPNSEGDVDICIGFNDDWSRPSPETLELVSQHFRHAGYSIGINDPYANSLAPDLGFEYKSIMIELNKRLYLNEIDYSLLPQAASVKKCLENLYCQLLAAVR